MDKLTSSIFFHPVLPQKSRVIRRSIIGEADARPGYAALRESIKPALPGPAATMAPPTGTMKFLSVLWTTASTLPRRQAAVTRVHNCLACTPCQAQVRTRRVLLLWARLTLHWEEHVASTPHRDFLREFYVAETKKPKLKDPEGLVWPPKLNWLHSSQLKADQPKQCTVE